MGSATLLCTAAPRWRLGASAACCPSVAPRTNRMRRVLRPVLTGHAASCAPYQPDALCPRWAFPGRRLAIRSPLVPLQHRARVNRPRDGTGQVCFCGPGEGGARGSAASVGPCDRRCASQPPRGETGAAGSPSRCRGSCETSGPLFVLPVALSGSPRHCRLFDRLARLLCALHRNLAMTGEGGGGSSRGSSVL